MSQTTPGNKGIPLPPNMRKPSLFRASDTQSTFAEAFAGRAHKPDCIFCEPPDVEVLEDAALFRVLDNIYPYLMWDERKVESHLMLVPKRHVDALSKLNADEQKEWFKIIGEYEAKGYAGYTRAPQSEVKTIPHLHTHLFKLGPEIIETLNYSWAEGTRITFSKPV